MNDSRRSQTPPLRSVASHRSPRESSPSTDTGAPEPSGLAHIRRSLQTQGIRGQAADLYCASWRGSTTSSYSSCWQRWFKWCRSKQINPTEAPLAKIINFLTDLFLEGKDYSTINSYRLAISAIHIEQIGKDQVLNRFMQGIFNSRPPKPKCTWIWDVIVLLNHMKSMSDLFELSNVSIQRLSQKVVTLLALSNADRSSDIYLLNIEHMRISDCEAKLQVAGLSKTRRSGPPREVTYHCFTKKEVCPVPNELRISSKQGIGDERVPSGSSVISHRNLPGLLWQC